MRKVLGQSDGIVLAVARLWPLVACGLALELCLLLAYAAGAYLDWYPSRLGGYAAWIEDHLSALGQPIVGALGNSMPIVAGATYLAALFGAFGAYGKGLCWASRLRRGTPLALGVILAFNCLFSLSLLLQPYLASQDIFSYAFYARILAFYHHNPYVDVPRDFPFEPLFAAIFWKDQPSNYGPVWTYLSGVVALVAGQSVASTLFALKGLVALLALLGVPLVWSILGQVSPRDRLAGTVLYAWNPLLVIETSGNGHNDVVMAFFLLLAIWLHLRQRPGMAVAALVASALAKYVAILLLPLYVALLLRQSTTVRQQLLVVARSALVAGSLIVVAFLPVYRGPATLQVISFGANPLAYTNSPLELAFRELRVALGESRDLASLPLRYRGWWVETLTPTVFWSKVDDPKAAGVSLPTSTPLLVVEPRQGRWLHVYESRTDRFGYVPAAEVTPVPPPRNVATAGATAAVLEDASRSPIAQRANLILRVLVTVLFLSVYAVLLWRTRTLTDLLRWSLVALFLSYWLIETWFWPWYLIWSLAFAALQPRSRLTVLILGFSLTTLALYLGSQGGLEVAPYLAVAYEYRSAAVFGLPVVLAVIWYWRLRARRAGVQEARADLTGVGSGNRPRSSRPRRRLVWVAVALLVQVMAGASVGVVLQRASPGAIVDPRSAYIAWETEYRAGLEYLRSQQYSRAAAALTRAAHHRPDLLDTYRARYVAFIQVGKYDEAIADLTLLLSVEGEQSSLLLARGDAYHRKQRFDSALRDFARAAELDPLDPQPYRRQALAYFHQGRLDEALSAQRLAVSLAPGFAPLYRELGDIYAGRHEYERALVMYDRAVALDDTQVQAYVSRAAALRILGRPEQTVSDLQRVLVLSDDVDERSWARRALLAMAGAGAAEKPQP